MEFMQGVFQGFVITGFYVAGYIPAARKLKRYLEQHTSHVANQRFAYVGALFWPFVVFGIWIDERLDH